MSVLIIGDLHIKKDNLDIMRNVCNEILQIIETRKPTLVVSVGDTLDTNERLFMPALEDATNFYKAISKITELVVLIGNHDRMNNNDFLSTTHPFIGLTEYPNMTIVHTTVWDKEKNFIYTPYVPIGRFNEALSKVGYDPLLEGDDLPRPKFIFAHQEFNNVNLGNKLSDSTDQWNNTFPQIFSGHIHEYQLLPKVVYVGTPLQQNYGESHDKALMMIYPGEGDKFNAERIRLNSAPIRVTIDMDISELPNFSSKIPPNCMVRVLLHYDATESEGLKKNPYYLALKSMVDKVQDEVVSNKANIAEKMVNEFKEKGTLSKEKKIYSVREIVIAMLADDPYTLNIYNTRVATK